MGEWVSTVWLSVACFYFMQGRERGDEFASVVVAAEFFGFGTHLVPTTHQSSSVERFLQKGSFHQC